ncbi:hypothetical protein M8J76_012751 [Diaphorina citri]|nr:hypothetical protein M8J76_012751 [Diaphorina citri]
MQLRFVPSCLAVILVFGCLLSLSGASKVVELSDRFIDIINEESSWLIMFYAPWCAHCKRLEPIWAHVAQNLARVSSIRVGKLDCTVHTNTCRKFNVRMYPTIMFIKGTDIHFTFQGDRNTEDIINFALRVSGPPVLKITKSKSIEELKNKNQVFFLYVGPPDTNHPLYAGYHSVATKFQPLSFFYSLANHEFLQTHVEFGWIGSPELANRIAMQYLSLPHLIVLNSTTNHHHIPQDEPLQLTHEAVVMFLDSVLNQSAQMNLFS